MVLKQVFCQANLRNTRENTCLRIRNFCNQGAKHSDFDIPDDGNMKLHQANQERNEINGIKGNTNKNSQVSILIYLRNKTKNCETFLKCQNRP